MRTVLCRLLLVVVLSFALPATCARGADTVLETDVRVPMRDGVELSTDILRPAGAGTFSTMLVRTPYDKGEAIRDQGEYPRHGCAAVIQDVRGRYKSGGEFYAFINEADDGFDTIEWIAAQPWSDGRVVMSGGSYLGIVQLQAALARPPHLAAIMPAVPTGGNLERLVFHGGELRQELVQGWMIGMAKSSTRVIRNEAPADELREWRPQTDPKKYFWRLPLRDPGALRLGGEKYVEAWSDIVASWRDASKWKAMDATKHASRIEVPVMMFEGWYDIFVQETIELWRALRRSRTDVGAAPVHLLVGPWAHGIGEAAGDREFPDARKEVNAWREAWRKHYLLGEPMDPLPPMKFYVINSKRWIDTDVWPPAGSRPTPVYLVRDGDDRRLSLDASAGKGELSRFTSDPEDPVLTLGGNNLTVDSGIADHQSLGERDDVLVFMTDPLDEDVTIAGEVRANLFVSTDGPDTDFTALLADYDERTTNAGEGYAANVCDGIVRLRYRNGREAQLVAPGEVVEISIDMWSTAYTFEKGHRIVLCIAGSNFPRFSRNLNTADPPADAVTPRKARNTVYHDAERASFVELPRYELR